MDGNSQRPFPEQSIEAYKDDIGFLRSAIFMNLGGAIACTAGSKFLTDFPDFCQDCRFLWRTRPEMSRSRKESFTSHCVCISKNNCSSARRRVAAEVNNTDEIAVGILSRYMLKLTLYSWTAFRIDQSKNPPEG